VIRRASKYYLVYLDWCRLQDLDDVFKVVAVVFCRRHQRKWVALHFPNLPFFDAVFRDILEAKDTLKDTLNIIRSDKPFPS
jgi:hypothetical protein